ncbi:MAG: cysteine hydrolase [Alphaproteobacteria bacterium]
MLDHPRIIPFSRVRRCELAPLIIFLDMQAEFVSEGRLLHIENTAPALSNARLLLEHARETGLSIAHCRFRHYGNYFNPDTPYSTWIEGFEPHGSEMVFERNKPSCYTNPSFERMMEAGGGHHAVIVGFMGSTSCLATIIDAHERGQNMKFAHDASASIASGHMSELQAHRAAVHVASHFGDLITTEEILTQCVEY